MPTYGIHKCLYLDEDVAIYKERGDWYLTISVQFDAESDTEEFDYKITHCPFCGKELK